MSDATGNIVWLASYPKSGNTWMRMFLHALKTGEPIETLDKVESTDGIASSRNIIDIYLGVDSADMPEIEIQKLRTQVNQLWSDDLKELALVKTHDRPFYKGHQIITKSCTKKAVLIVRNPFDIVASYANHMNSSISNAVNSLCNDAAEMAISKRSLNNQVAQHLGSWSSFYQSWKNLFRDDLLIVKYEDMKLYPVKTFGKVVKEIGWKNSENEIKKALVNSDFKILQSIENNLGFREKPRKTKNFFRKGDLGGWRNEISQEQAQQLIDCHYYTLLELGYINSKGEILV